jgi:16S rRNA (guanine966-N2)-methyltransferase
VLSEFGDLDGAHVMDLYAGSGAVGLEALSRGAKSVLLVESDARAAAVIATRWSSPTRRTP